MDQRLYGAFTTSTTAAEVMGNGRAMVGWWGGTIRIVPSYEPLSLRPTIPGYLSRYLDTYG